MNTHTHTQVQEDMNVGYGKIKRRVIWQRLHPACNQLSGGRKAEELSARNPQSALLGSHSHTHKHANTPFLQCALEMCKKNLIWDRRLRSLVLQNSCSETAAWLKLSRLAVKHNEKAVDLKITWSACKHSSISELLIVHAPHPPTPNFEMSPSIFSHNKPATSHVKIFMMLFIFFRNEGPKH